jgi:hypothetical protein
MALTSIASSVGGRSVRLLLPALVAATSLLAGGAFAARAGAQSLESELLPADPAAAQLFGQSVALQGDLAVVGAAGAASNAGAAYVFRRTLSVWGQELKLAPGDLENADLFGAGTTLEGDLIAVGAPDSLDVFGGGTPGPGAVYVFRDTGGTWPQQAKLVAADAAIFDQLGRSVDTQGDLLVAGAPGDQPTGDGDPAGGQGAAYVFHFDGLAWVQDAKLVAPHGGNGDRLGKSIAIDGEVIAVGSPGYDNPTADVGAVLVFRRSAGVWTFEAKLTALDPAAGDSFGESVAVDGDLIAIGAPKDNQGFSDTGAVYLFRFNGTFWAQETKLVASDAAGNAQLGASVALQVPMLLSGSPGAAGGAGKGYLFAEVGPSWLEASQISQGASLFCGQGAALDGTEVLLGAPWTANGSLLFAGSAYAFEAFTDCNGNALPDDTDIETGLSLDCNGNDVPDECDLASGFSQDCDGNSVPDECDPDLNGNLIPDACEGTWTDLGNGLAGTTGEPLFEGEGPLIADLSVTLSLSNALPESQSALFIGLSSILAPFKGGVVVPNPDILILGLPTGPLGELVLTAHWPHGLPAAFTLYFQHWILDPAAPAGLSASNGLAGTTPP